MLLAAPLWVSVLGFLSGYGKPTDPGFGVLQPLQYVPLNLVISDLKFYGTETLGKIGIPAFYVLFVGWIPVICALWSV